MGRGRRADCAAPSPLGSPRDHARRLAPADRPARLLDHLLRGEPSHRRPRRGGRSAAINPGARCAWPLAVAIAVPSQVVGSLGVVALDSVHRSTAGPHPAGFSSSSWSRQAAPPTLLHLALSGSLRPDWKRRTVWPMSGLSEVAPRCPIIERMFVRGGSRAARPTAHPHRGPDGSR